MVFPVDRTGTMYGSGDPNATPSPEYTGVFIPTLWAGKLIEKFYAATVLAGIANTDYSGDIASFGDKVVIRTKPDVTISAYTADTTLQVERPSSASVELDIDKGFYFNAVLDDVMEIQMDLDALNMWSDDASEQMKIKIDDEVLTYLPTAVGATNSGTGAGAISTDIDLGGSGSPLLLSPTNILDKIVEAGQCLDENNIPEQGRWMVVPAWFAAMIKKSDLKDASLTNDGQTMLRNGRLGMIDRFTLYVSNLLPEGTETGKNPHHIPFGHATGLTFASQVTKMETLRAESTFGTLLRGLQVYGRKVTDDTAIGEIYGRNST